MSEAGRIKRLKVWKHNGFLGSIRFAQTSLNNIITADTTTQVAKDRAGNILSDLDKLKNDLAVRVDVE